MWLHIVELGEFLAGCQEQQYCAREVLLYVAQEQLVNAWVVCWDQDSAHRRRVLDVLMYFRILEKAKNVLYISKKHVSAKTDYNPAS